MALASKGIANESSRIKMRVFTSVREENKCWFSPADENKKPTDEIINGMKERFLNNLSSGAIVINAKINWLIWYDVHNGGQELDKFKP